MGKISLWCKRGQHDLCKALLKWGAVRECADSCHTE